MKYNVATIRASGLEAKWVKQRNGGPIIVAKKPGQRTWYAVGRDMWTRAEKVGIMEAFSEHTLLGDIFSVAI